MNIEQREELIELYDLYYNLLTEKQQVLLRDFLDNNLSISELAVEYNSTRQAVNDLLKRTFRTLEEYEKKLGLLSKLESVKKNVALALKSLDGPNFDKQFLTKKLNEILEVL